jgi:glutathione S-transferase
MKLYFSEGACSMASHIALNEAAVSYTPVAMSFDKGDFAKPEFLTLNPMGAIPVLELDDGRTLTEGVAIMQYVATLNPEAKLAPKAGTFEHFEFLKWMNFIATELHKGFSPLFYTARITKNEDAQKDIRDFTLQALDGCFEVVDQQLAKTQFLCGQNFTVADGYLFTILSWAPWTKVDYSKHKNLAAYIARIGERPAVLKTIQIEESLSA